MILKATLTLLFVTTLITGNIAQTTPNLKLDSFINKKVFHYKNNSFTGEGWDTLQAEIKRSHIVLIGEQHGEAEIPVFTEKVAEVLQPKALVVEIDPYTAARLKKESTNVAGYSSYFKQNPYDFAFYSYKTEMELARQMTLNHIDIWGLNEVNFLSMGTFFNTLAANAKIPANKKLALKKALEFAAADKPIYQDVNKFGDFSAYKLKAQTVDSLLYAFRNESAICKKMLTDLKLTIPILANTSYDSRTNLMKKNLLNYLHSYITADAINIPRLLFKFGANHVPRTNDIKGSFEAGNLADNLADAAGKKTLHIFIFGKQGTVNAMAPVNNKKAIVPYNVATDRELAMFKPFYEPVQSNEWALYDLRPLREAINNGKITIEPAIKGFIMGYDLMVIFDETTGNRFIE